MRAKWFCDIDVRGGSEETGMAVPVVRGKILAHLHPVFKRYPHTYALAVPSNVGYLRVFASTRDQLDLLVEHLSANPWMRDYAILKYPRAVAEDFSGSWTIYRRYRIPTLKTDRKEGTEHGALRQRRLNSVVVNKMDYFCLRSSSNRQLFTLVVERKSGVRSTECLPNGYGLSSGNSPFALPDLP